MKQHFFLMIVQFNPSCGNLNKNLKKIKESYSRAINKNVDLLAFPEMSLTGYQAQDLILKPSFMLEVNSAINQLKLDLAGGIPVLIGAPLYENGRIYNAYYLINNGEYSIVSRKHHLPNVNVFDEKRVFTSGPISKPFEVLGVKIGTPICEDLWFEDVAGLMVETGADFLISPNGSPYSREKIDTRTQIVIKRSVETNVPIVYLNMTGGQDDLIFDGASFVLNPGGKHVVSLPQFEETEEVINFVKVDNAWLVKPGVRSLYDNVVAQDYRAMVESLKEYTRKSGFSKVILGLSGGVDSALVATIATDAMGPKNVLCVRLPSKFSSQGSLDDAANLVDNLNCLIETISIDPANEILIASLANAFQGYQEDLTEENIQSRLRGVILMALSNKFNMMLLTTGNKSEVAVGYSTIYGDMAGGYNPIKDLYKTRVFETCLWRNVSYEKWMMGPEGTVIPVSIIDKPPSAELRFDQRDDESLPPYDILDSILVGLIDNDLGVNDLVAQGFDKTIVKKIENLIYLSEYKRFQSAPGPNLTDRAFGSGRRYPLVQQWRDQS
ncbi:MAG: NAD+ synthase [Paracoccaceae bacterium]|nr:NAD+ synthase [Paracoccaceae bacterium]